MLEDTDPALIERARHRLAAAKRICVLTGAGISAESGIPTFRDALTGLWSRYRPEDLATPEAFRRDPRTVWEWYAWRREKVASVAPNAGHRALAALERRCEAEGRAYGLVTQNVDGLHQLAGSRNVFELHGSIRRVKCLDAGHPASAWDSHPVPPLCARCGSMLRPDVVWFGEMLPPQALEEAMRLAAHCDLFLCVGTSTLVEPAASLPFVARGARATVIEVNPHPTPLTEHAHFVLAGPAGMVLPAIISPFPDPD